jgi:diketogulonate reductase-like aldo/keto reductase
MEEPVVKDIANSHNKTPAQILLRYLVQLGIVVIPKSTNPDRLKLNFQVELNLLC